MNENQDMYWYQSEREREQGLSAFYLVGCIVTTGIILLVALFVG